MTSPKKVKHKKRVSKIVDPAREARLQAQREKDTAKAHKRLALRQKFAALREARNVPKALVKIVSHESDERNERGRREKILRYRRAQSRYKLPKITIDDDMDDIAANMESLEQRISINNTSKTEEASETVIDNDTKEDMPTNSMAAKSSTDQLQINDYNEDTESQLSMLSVDTMVLSDEQEQSMIELEVALEAADPEFYGFIPFKRFLNILVDNKVQLSLKQETYILGALILLDEGVDYCSFIRSVRELGSTLLIDTTLSEIVQELADTAEKAAHKRNVNTNNASIVDDSAVAEVNDADLEKFMYEYRGRDRGLSLKNASKVAANIPKTTKLGLLIDDLMLDGAMVDFALLKTAFAIIEEYPADDDLKYLIRYLCESEDEIVDDDVSNLEIDFNYFLSFLQETTSTPVQNMKRISPVIAKIVKQMKIVKRAEDRRTDQLLKSKHRLEKRNTQRFGQKAETEMADLVKEEKRLKRLRLRDEAMKRYR